MGLWARLFGGSKPAAPAAPAPEKKRRYRYTSIPADKRRQFSSANGQAPGSNGSSSAIAGANAGWGASVWSGSTDDFNQDYLQNIHQLIQNSQDLYINNPDVQGWLRMRVAQIVGRGIAWKSAMRPDEVGMSPEAALATNIFLNRRRELHSTMGGFDATGAGRTEGKLQEITLLTMFAHGTALVHRLHRPGKGRMSPLAIEIIPGSRIETPVQRLGDPLISWGFEYTDNRRTKLVGVHVRKPNRSIGAGGTVWDYQYDFIPLEDLAIFRITEIAGLDRSVPAVTCLIRSLRNKGEFAEATLSSARAQAKRFGFIEVEEGADPWARSADDNQQSLPASDDTENLPVGTLTLGEAELFYLNHGEKYTESAAKLPDPDFTGFMSYHDERCARGLNTSKSRFTRVVDGSYAAGRQEEQQDEPAVEQLLETFAIGWNRVHEWWIDAAVLSGLADLPNYTDLKAFYCQARVVAPGKKHLNPVDTAKARQVGMGLRYVTPQKVCEEDGGDLETNLREWAEAEQLKAKVEADHNLPAGTLDFLLEEKALPKTVGADDATAPTEDDERDEPKPINRVKGVLNGIH